MAIAVDLGHKATKQTNKQTTKLSHYHFKTIMNEFVATLTNGIYHDYEVTSVSEISPCKKIDKPAIRFSGNVMTYITTLRTL